MTKIEAQQIVDGLSATMQKAVQWMVYNRILETRIVRFSRWAGTMRALQTRKLVMYDMGSVAWYLNKDGRKVARIMMQTAKLAGGKG